MSQQQWGHGYWTGYAEGQKQDKALVSRWPCTCAGCQEIQRQFDEDENDWKLAEDLGFFVSPSGGHIAGATWYLYCLRHRQPWIFISYAEHNGDRGFRVEADLRPSRYVLTEQGCAILLRWLQQYSKISGEERSSSWGLNPIVADLSNVPIADARTFAQLVLLVWHRYHQPVEELPGYLDKGRPARAIDRAAKDLQQRAIDGHTEDEWGPWPPRMTHELAQHREENGGEAGPWQN